MKTLITFTNLLRLTTATIFSALALSCGALSIAVADNSDVPQTVVKFGDLNLSNPQGAAKLYSRIEVAAYEVCKSFDINARDVVYRAQLEACVHKAIAGAVTRCGRPELFAIYKEKNLQPLAIIVAKTR